MSLDRFKKHLNEASSKNPDLLQLVMFYRQLVVATNKGDDALAKKIKIKIYEYERKLDLSLGKF
jgi:hypothetical protein